MEGNSRKRKTVSAFAARPTPSSASAARQSDEDMLTLLEEELMLDGQGYEEDTTDSPSESEEAVAEPAPVVHPSRRQNVHGGKSPSKGEGSHAPTVSACSQWRWTTASLHTDIPGHAVLTLQEGESLCLCGYADMAVISGAVEVDGFVMAAAPQLRYRPLFSPRSSSLQCVRAPFPPSATAVPQSLTCEDQDESVTRRLQDLVEEYGQSCAAMIVLREPGQQSRAAVDAITRGRHYRTLFTLDKDGESKEADPLKLSTVRLLLAPREGVRQFTAPNEWVATAQALLGSTAAPVTLVCGGKDVGKSSLTRYLVNALLNRYPQVAHMELDIGQGEFTPPGIISLIICDQPLLGPPPTQQRQPQRQYFVGDTSPKHDPTYYMRCVRALVADARQMCGAGTPIVVNTHGWIKGIGLELLYSVAALVQPSHIAAFSAPDAPASLAMPPLTASVIESAFERDMWSVLSDWPRQGAYSPQLFELPVTVKSAHHSGFRAADFRQMALSAYFAPSRLTTYAVPLRSVAVHVVNVEVARSQVLYAANASVVALVSDTAAREWTEQNQSEDCQSLPRFLPHTPVAPCCGLGYIESIDSEAGELRLSTPAPATELSEVSVLLRGAVDVDPEIYPGGNRKAYTMPATNKHASGTQARSGRRGLLRRKHQ